MVARMSKTGRSNTVATAANTALHLTAYRVRSCVAPASGGR